MQRALSGFTPSHTTHACVIVVAQFRRDDPRRENQDTSIVVRTVPLSMASLYGIQYSEFSRTPMVSWPRAESSSLKASSRSALTDHIAPAARPIGSRSNAISGARPTDSALNSSRSDSCYRRNIARAGVQPLKAIKRFPLTKKAHRNGPSLYFDLLALSCRSGWWLVIFGVLPSFATLLPSGDVFGTEPERRHLGL